MITKIFNKLTKYPFFRRLVWPPIYQGFAKLFPVEEWVCMNYGYADDTLTLGLVGDDLISRYPLQLYHMTASQAGSLKGKDVLEVGSGRGGGASYIKRYLEAGTMTGMDLSKNAVDFCKERHKIPGLNFVAGNAEKLPFPDHSFDVVVNVESCHTYGSVPKFLSEVKRVLRPGGYLLITDFRPQERMEILIRQLTESGMKVISQRDISPNVEKSIEDEDAQKRERITRELPKWIVPVFIEFAGVTGSAMDKGLRAKELIYNMWALQKN